MSNPGFSSILIAISILVAIISGLAFYRLGKGKKANRTGKYTKGYWDEEEDGMALGMGTGLALGMLLGTMTDNLGLGIALGISIGAAMGAAFSSEKEKK